MGGMGSGRHWYWDAKKSTNDYRSIDVRRWKRKGLLEPNNVFTHQWFRNGQKVASIQVTALGSGVELQYQKKKYSGDQLHYRYIVKLEQTPCHLGGERTWFLCPTVNCNRRVAILYLGHHCFACRHCLKLAYQSQRDSLHDRQVRRANQLRRYMGWPPGIFSPPGIKPKGMHWKTYDRLLMEYLDVTGVTLHEIIAQLNLRKDDV